MDLGNGPHEFAHTILPCGAIYVYAFILLTRVCRMLKQRLALVEVVPPPES